MGYNLPLCYYFPLKWAGYCFFQYEWPLGNQCWNISYTTLPNSKMWNLGHKLDKPTNPGVHTQPQAHMPRNCGLSTSKLILRWNAFGLNNLCHIIYCNPCSYSINGAKYTSMLSIFIDSLQRIIKVNTTKNLSVRSHGGKL